MIRHVASVLFTIIVFLIGLSIISPTAEAQWTYTNNGICHDGQAPYSGSTYGAWACPYGTLQAIGNGTYGYFTVNPYSSASIYGCATFGVTVSGFTVDNNPYADSYAEVSFVPYFFQNSDSYVDYQGN